MGITRRKFMLEFKTEAAHRVIDTAHRHLSAAARPHPFDADIQALNLR
jgi:hypothetical protein